MKILKIILACIFSLATIGAFTSGQIILGIILAIITFFLIPFKVVLPPPKSKEVDPNLDKKDFKKREGNCKLCGTSAKILRLNNDSYCINCQSQLNFEKKAQNILTEIQEFEEKLRDKQTLYNKIHQDAIDDATKKLEQIIYEKELKIVELDKLIADKDSLYSEMKKEAEKVAMSGLDETIQQKLNEISKFEETIDNLKNEITNSEKNLKSITNKILKCKPTYKSMCYALKQYVSSEDIINNFNIVTDENIEYCLTPTANIYLHCMDFKELRKRYKENEIGIKEILERYSSRYTTKANIAIYKLMIIALEAELQNILYTLSYGKVDESIEKVKQLIKKYRTIASEGNQSIAVTITQFLSEIEYLYIQAVKIEYEYYVKKEKAKEEQRALREQMRQEAEEKRILEQQKKQVEAEELKYQTEISNIQDQINNTKDNEQILLLQKRINELQEQLNNVEIQKDEIIRRQNGKAGYVYIISNIGSFGQNVFKVGMTRRLDPQDRVNELGDASVPFPFDVHSFIFSDNAVDLEHQMHTILDEKRVNKVNLRKEFFNVTVDELENLVFELQPTAEFKKTMIAEQYKQSISLQNDKNYIFA